MTIKSIVEIENKTFPNQAPVKERMDINIPKITAENIPRRNGSIYVLCGSGGSGKTSLLLNMFKTKLLYRKNFIIYIIFVLLHHFHQLQTIHLKIMRMYITNLLIVCWRIYIMS